MRFLLVSWSLLGLLATPWVSAVIYRDVDFDAIVIDDQPDDSLELEVEEESSTTAPDSSPNCTNSNGVYGTCMKFEQCFPYLSDYESEGFNRFILYDILKDATGPCQENPDLVCCPDYSYGIPTRKPQFEGQTTEPSPATSTVNSTRSANSTDDDFLKNRNGNCGANSYQDEKVVGGHAAEPGQFPYAVALLNNGKQFCGGSLISEQWVLTAAHCIVNLRTFTKVAVNVGDHDHSKLTEVKHQERKVKRGFYNKDFSMRTLQHDVALLQLDRAVTYGKGVQPVCLSSTPPPYDSKAVLAGWGKKGKHLPPSTVLQTVTMRIIPYEECKATYAKEPQAPPVTTGMVCAGEQKPTLKDACNGDSGGPLSVIDGGKATQIGIVSWGIGCGDKPGVYTRVDQYRPWIDKNSKRTYSN